MKKLFFCILILIIAVHISKGQQKNNTNPKIDSLEAVLSKTSSSRQKIKLTIDLANAYNGVDFKKMHLHADKAIQLAQKNQVVDTLLVKGYQIKGDALIYLRQFEEASTILQKALTLSKSIGNQKLTAFSYNLLAIAVQYQGKFSKAYDYYQKAYQAYQDAKNQIGMAKITVNIGGNYSRQGDHKKALKYYNKALKLFEKLQRRGTDLFSLHYNLGRSYHRLDNYSQAIAHLQQSLSFAQEENYQSGIASIYNQLGLVYETQKKLARALDAYHKSLKIKLQMNNLLQAANTYANLASLYRTRKDYQKATEYYQKAAEICKNNKEPEKMSFFTSEMGKVCLEQKKYQEALKYFKQALEVSQRFNFQRLIPEDCNYLSITYLKLKQYQKAYEHAQKALATSEENQDVKLSQKSYLTLAEVYFQKQEFSKALQAGEKAYQLAQKIEVGKAPQIEVTAAFLTKAYEQHQNYSKALHYHKIFKTVSDSLLNEEEIKKITTLENEYQYEQEKVLTKLKHEQKETQLANKVQQQTNLRNTFIISTVFLLLLALLILVIYWNKNKAHKALQQKNEVINLQAEELKATNEMLDELNQFKQEMTNMLVHDLKNPLNAIISLTEDTYKPQHQQTVYQSGQNMLNLVSNMLGVQKLEASTIKLQKNQVGLSTFVLNAYQQVAYLFQEKNIHIDLDLPNTQSIALDEDIMQRVIVNLLSNAAKYTPNNGQVSLTTEVLESNFIKIYIKDNGEGIAPEDLDVIFEKYQQANPQRLGVTPSTGLGLSFCKLAVEAHKGELGVTSVEGNGSIFWFTLPLPSVDEYTQTLEEKSNTNYSISTQLQFTTEEKQYVLPFVEKIRQYEVFEVSAIRPILQSMSISNQENLQKWKTALEESMYTSNLAHFEELLNIT